MDTSALKVCVIGQGYVGLPLAFAAVQAGYRVIGLDTDRRKVEAINHGQSPIEDVDDDDLKYMLAHNYHATDNHLAQFNDAYETTPDIWVVTVPTPLKDGRPDLTYVRQAGQVIGRSLKKDALVILESTVAPGTTRQEFLGAIQLAAGKRSAPGVDFYLGFSPERIDPGNKEYSFNNTTKLVAGFSYTCRAKVHAFYQSIMQPWEVHTVSSLEVAETAKLLENTYRHVNIALVNELARHCYALGINVWDVIHAAETKPYGFQAFYPGPGVGGHCLPVDPAYLGDKVKVATGNSFHFVDLAMRINDSQPEYVVQRVVEMLNERKQAVNGSRILVLGYAYKGGTGDARETPAEAVVDGLHSMGADVRVYDPHVKRDDVSSDWDTLFGAKPWDMVVVLTVHDDTASRIRVLSDGGVPILDTRNIADTMVDFKPNAEYRLL